MDFINEVTGIAVAVYKTDFHFGVINQQPEQFTAGIACAANDAGFNF